MTWIAPAILAFQTLLLMCAAANDIATRTIPNTVSIALAILGLARLALNPADAALSLSAAAIVFLLLIAAHARGWLGGGDVKLISAMAIGLPITALAQLLMMIAVCGLGLALIHLGMRLLPDPEPSPAGASLLRRVYAVERWRNRRRAPLPYGAAVAFAGVWLLFGLGH